MKNDFEVKLYMSERSKGKTQRQAAARAGMSERTARKYERAGKLPSELKRPHDWQTRKNPFEQDWPWVIEQLERDPARAARARSLHCCVKSIQDAIVRPRTAHCGGILPGGELCTDPSKR